MLSTNVNFNDHHIAGPIVLYLTNGKVLTVINRVNSDNVDDQSIVLYSLPQAQITPLKQASIRTIRYSIVNNGFKASYTAENKGETKMINISQDIQYEQKVPYNTAIEVAELFSTEGQ